MRLAAGAVALEQRLALAADLGDAEEQVLGRDVLVAEPPGLLLGPLDDAPWRAGRGSASRPGSGRAGRGSAASSPRNAGRSTPSRRRVSAGMPSSGSTSAREDVLGVEDRALRAAAAVCLGGDDGLLGLLGESVELHVRSLSVSRVSAGRVGRRGRGRSRAAAVRLVGQVGRQDDAGLDVAGRRARRP